jgi:hypothetical protein
VLLWVRVQRGGGKTLIVREVPILREQLNGT